jgi:hypothetical protein
MTERKQKRQGKTVPDNRLAQEYYTIYATKQYERKNRDYICPTYKPGKYGQASSTSAPSVEKLNPPGGIGIKKDVLLNTPTLTWVNARRGYLKKGVVFLHSNLMLFA